MSEREMQIFVIAILYAKSDNDSNPDVGMAPSLESVAKQVALRLSFRVPEEAIAEAVGRVERRLAK